MSYDLSVLWGWLIWALLIGLIVGWMTWRRESEGPWFVGGPRAAAVAFVVGLVVAALKLFPGRLGFWLESGLFFFATYVIGCLLGGWLRGTRERPSLAAAATAAGGAGVLTAQRRSEPAAPPRVKSPEGAQRPTPAAAAKVAETMSTAAKVAAAPQAPISVPASSIARVPGNDLTRLRTITSQDQAKLNSLGVRSYADIAGWSSADQLTIEQ